MTLKYHNHTADQLKIERCNLCSETLVKELPAIQGTEDEIE